MQKITYDQEGNIIAIHSTRALSRGEVVARALKRVVTKVFPAVFGVLGLYAVSVMFLTLK